MSVTSSASSPPTRAIATLARISNAHLKDQNIVYKIRKMIAIVIGTTVSNRWSARFLV
jgi:hypothetical protein